MYLISPHLPQYRANLHCHSTISDGKLTPQQLKDLYKSEGYQVLSITDHEVPKSHYAMSDPDFLMLTGYEFYTRPGSDGQYNRYAPETHLNLFARDPHNETIICYDPRYCKYMPAEYFEALPHAGSQRPRVYTPAYVNEVIQTARENGYLVAYNHPYWSMESEADILSYEGCFSMEMINYSSYVGNYLEHNSAVYDKLLQSGKRIYCHGADDNHNTHPVDSPYSDSFGGFTMIQAKDLSYSSIMEAMEKGNMYASMGPRFREVSLENDVIHVECSEVSGIFAYFGSKKPAVLLAEPGKTLTAGDLKVDPNARYIRVSIRDKEGKWADTRGFFRDELGLPSL